MKNSVTRRHAGLLMAGSVALSIMACGSPPSLHRAVGDVLGDPVDIQSVKSLCDLPVGAPLTGNVVFLGCAQGGVPVLLDMRCQELATSSRSCAYSVEAFASPAGKANPAEARLLQP